MGSIQTHPLFSERAGSGPTQLVLLHGLGGSGRYWYQVRDELDPERFTMHLVDLLGFGRSPWPDVEYTLEEHVAALERWRADVLGTARFICIGHSLGAILAEQWAKRTRAIAKLVLVSFPILADPSTAQIRLARLSMLHRLTLGNPAIAHLACQVVCHSRPVWRFLAPLLDRRVPRAVAQDAVLHTERSFFGTLKHCALEQPAALSNSPSEPRSLFIHGDRDPVASIDDLRRQALSRPNAWLQVLPGAGHDLPLTHPKALADMIARFAQVKPD